MIKRIVEVANPAYLHVRRKQMIVERDGEQIGSVPIEDMGVLIIDHPQVTHSQRLLQELAENQTVVVFSDQKHLPSAVLLPLSGHSLHTRILREQIALSEPTRKRLWQVIVKAKIGAQNNVLARLHQPEEALAVLAENVRSGDPDNCEGQAARIYWRRLFGETFRRDPLLPGINALLNYGYAIIRAAVARSIVGAGLHPALGLHHHNQYDSLCLADDLVEPIRPLVDITVFRYAQSPHHDLEVNSTSKPELLKLLTCSLQVKNQALPITAALPRYTASLREVITRERQKLLVPVLLLDPPGEEVQ
jgi:CRISPR-associated protein Cas1